MIELLGRPVVESRSAPLKSRISALVERIQRSVGLAVVLIGEDPASQIYVRNKMKACADYGIQSFEHRLPPAVTQAELLRLLETLNNDTQVDGILVQFPLPPHISREAVLNQIDPLKDADGLTPQNLGLLFTRRPRVVPCTPWGIQALLEHYKFPLSGRHAAVIGRSEIVGNSMAQLLLKADATVTICHSKTKNIREICLQSDLVVVAAGQPRFMGRDDFKKGSIVIDVGIHRVQMPGQEKPKVVGDVRYEELKDWASAATPVPGGVGVLTIQMLIENTVTLAEISSRS